MPLLTLSAKNLLSFLIVVQGGGNNRQMAKNELMCQVDLIPPLLVVCFDCISLHPISRPVCHSPYHMAAGEWGGVLTTPGILPVCHLRGLAWLWENFALQKGPLLTFCLTKGCLIGPQNALQQGLFLPKIKVSALKMFRQCQITLNHTFWGAGIFWSDFPNLPYKRV